MQTNSSPTLASLGSGGESARKKKCRNRQGHIQPEAIKRIRTLVILMIRRTGGSIGDTVDVTRWSRSTVMCYNRAFGGKSKIAAVTVDEILSEMITLFSHDGEVDA